MLGSVDSEKVRLSSREIIFQELQPIYIFIMKVVHEVQETKQKKCKKVQSASMCSS